MAQKDGAHAKQIWSVTNQTQASSLVLRPLGKSLLARFVHRLVHHAYDAVEARVPVPEKRSLKQALLTCNLEHVAECHCASISQPKTARPCRGVVCILSKKVKFLALLLLLSIRSRTVRKRAFGTCMGILKKDKIYIVGGVW